MNWQPIEIAPKDGTEIRVKLSCGRVTVAEYWPEAEGWAFETTAFFGESEIGEPVEWMPLSEPPNA